MVWEYLRFTRIPDRHFKGLEPGKAIFLKDLDEDGYPKIRVGYYKKFENGSHIVYVPRYNCDCLVGFDGTNYYIDRH